MERKALCRKPMGGQNNLRIMNRKVPILNADLYEIVPEDPYTEEDLAYYTNGRADQEQNDASARPAISGGVENIEEYDTILLGYPNMEHSFESVLCA